MGALLADEVGDGFVVDKELIARNPAAGNTRDEPLGENAREACGELQTYLVLLTGRKRVDDAVDGLRGVVGVQCRQDEVPGFRGGYRRRHGLRAAHFSDQEHVHILAESGKQRGGEIFRVDADLALVDERLLGLKNVLDGVFYRDDVFHALDVDELNERRQCRRLPLPYRPHDQKESLLFPCEGREDVGKVEVFDAQNLFGDETQYDTDRPALDKSVPAKTEQIRALIGKIQLLVLFELCNERGIDQRLQKPLGILPGENRLLQHRGELAGDPYGRVGAGG